MKTTFMQLPGPASQDTKILMSVSNLFIFLYKKVVLRLLNCQTEKYMPLSVSFKDTTK